MSGNDEARALLDAVAGFTDEAPGGATPSQQRPVRLATVADDYSGSGAASVVFDGETVATTRTYLPLAPIAAEQRVVLLPVGNTYVIIGDLEAGLALMIAALESDVADAAAAASAAASSASVNAAAIAAIDAVLAALPLPFRIAAGVYTSGSNIGSNSGVSLDIALPSSRFTVAPVVVCIPILSSRINMAVPAVTTSQFTARLDNFTSGTAFDRDFFWIAIQMESGSAPG